MRERLRSLPARDLFIQISLVVGGFQIYEVGRHLIPPDWPTAIENAHRILRLEQLLHLDYERSLQDFFLADVPGLVRAMNVFYFVAHFLLTGVFFAWLYWRSRDGFRDFRNAFVVSTAIALAIHWNFPTAPPRLAGVGVHDTLRDLSDIDIGSPHSDSYSNPVAAIPSLHAGWAVAVGYGLWRYARHSLARVVAVAYPLAVTLTILVTGNHFVLDAVAGVAVMALGFAATSAARVAWPAAESGLPVVSWGQRRGVEQSGSSPGS